MKKILIRILLALIIGNLSLSIAQAQTWKKLKDSMEYYANIDDYLSAYKFAKLAMPIALKEFGEVDSNYTNILAVYTGYHYLTGNLDSAIYYQAKANNIMKIIYKGDHPNMAVGLSSLGSFYEAAGKNSDAEKMLKEGLDMCRRLFKEDNMYLANSLGAMSKFLNTAGRYSEAEVLAKEMYGITKRLFNGDHPFIIGSSAILGDILYYSGKYDEAEIYLKESLGMARRLYGGDNMFLARIMDFLVWINEAKGKFSEAEQILNESLEMRRRIFKGDHPDLALGINNAGQYYSRHGNFTQTESLLRESLDMSRRIYKTDSPQLLAVISNLAGFLDFRGNFREAESLYRESLEMSRSLYKGDHPDLARNISNIATFYVSKGRYKEGEPMIKEAFDMRRRLFKGDNVDLLNSINVMGSFLEAVGKYSDAELLYKEGLDMSRRLFKANSPELAAVLNSMAVFQSNKGNYGEAEKLFKESLTMRKAINKGDHPDVILALNNLATFLGSTGRFSEAEPLYIENLEMARRLFKNDHPGLANAISNYGTFLLNNKRLSEAEPLLREGLGIWRRLYKEGHPDLIGNINNMAGFLTESGRYDEAEPLLKEAVEMSRKFYPNDHPHLARCTNNYAYLLDLKGQLTEAEPLYKEALEMRRRLYGGSYTELNFSIIGMASFYDQQKKYELAEPLHLEAIKQNMNILNSYFPSLSEKEKKQFWNTMNNQFERFNNFAVARAQENPAIISNMYDITLYTKAMLLNSSNKVKSRILSSGDSALVKQYRSWSDMKEFLVKLYKMSNEELKSKNLNIDSVEKVANGIEKEISLKSEAFTQSYEKKKVTWKLIQAILKPDEAAVEVVRYRAFTKYLPTDTVFYAFLIVNDQTEEHPDIIVLSDGNQLESEYYNKYRTLIKNKQPDTVSFGRYWSKLHDKLKNYKKIYFSADGIYNKLNPSAFRLPDGKYLLDIQDIQQVNSTKDILLGFYKTKQESNIYNSALLIGNPNFSLAEEKVREVSKKLRGTASDDNPNELLSQVRGIDLAKLPGTEKEIMDIQKFLKSRNWVVNSFLGDLALKTAIKAASSPRVLHIATHGLFLEDVKSDSREIFGFDENRVIDNPLLRSGLFFSGADNLLQNKGLQPLVPDDADDNGLLTAYEAMNLDLDRTELVVLSACETGLGEVQNGEGVFGLRRAFQQAGAKSVLMSLWKVNDEATQELMSNFYKNWVTGMTKRDAFSKAQQEVRNKYTDPYYWGAFVMVGE